MGRVAPPVAGHHIELPHGDPNAGVTGHSDEPGPLSRATGEQRAQWEAELAAASARLDGDDPDDDDDNGRPLMTRPTR